MKELKRYIYEDNSIFELGEGNAYYQVTNLDFHEVKGNYAKVRLNYLLEHDLEFLVELANNDKFDEYFINYQREMADKENQVFGKMKIKDAMSKLLAQEIVIYQDLN